MSKYFDNFVYRIFNRIFAITPHAAAVINLNSSWTSRTYTRDKRVSRYQVISRELCQLFLFHLYRMAIPGTRYHDNIT